MATHQNSESTGAIAERTWAPAPPAEVCATVISADTTAARPVTCEDVINWSCRGTRDDIIIDRLQHSSNVFHISAADEIHLRDAGVSDEVIRAMKATAS